MSMPRFSAFAFCLGLAALHSQAAECEGWQSRHPDWIFCDDFETTAPMVAQGRYFEYNDAQGQFAAAAGIGWNGSRGMRARWQTAQVDAGNLKVSFGRVPNPAWEKGIRPGADFREVYYRLYMRTEAGWQGDPYKLTRATVLAKADWSQAMIAHLWGDRAEHLQLDPVRCVDANSAVKCSGYNDFTHMDWIGAKAGATPVYDASHAGKWTCVEAHVKLNDPGQSNGVHEFWIDDRLEARREGLNFLGTYQAYGLNCVFFENYWNSGSPQTQERYFDNIVISTARVTCAEGGLAPTGLRLGEPRENGSASRPGLLRFGWDAGATMGSGLLTFRRVDGRLITAPLAGPAAGIIVGIPDIR